MGEGEKERRREGRRGELCAFFLKKQNSDNSDLMNGGTKCILWKAISAFFA